MVGSGKFDRIREKGPDPTGSGSATLLLINTGTGAVQVPTFMRFLTCCTSPYFGVFLPWFYISTTCTYYATLL